MTQKRIAASVPSLNMAPPRPQRRFKPNAARIQHELRRQEVEAENQDSIFLRLPGEIRNEVYKYLIPHDQVITTDGTESFGVVGIAEGRTCQTVSIKKREAHGACFKLEKVCHQVRNEARKFFYGSNIFALRIVRSDEIYRKVYRPERRLKRDAARRWIKSLPDEALMSLSRVVMFRSRSGDGVTVATMALFDLERVSSKTLETEVRDVHDGGSDTFPREIDYDKVLQSIVGGGCVEMSRNKLLKLMQAFRTSLQK